MDDREIELKKQIGERVKELRTRTGLSMEAFANKINSTSATISNIENGKSIPGGAILINISNTFHVSSDWILKGTEPTLAQVNEKNDRLIFFNDKWQFFCRSVNYLSEEEKKRQEVVISLIEKISHLTDKDIELLSALIARILKEEEA